MHASTSPRCADPAPHWRQELVEALVCEATRPEARAKLDKLRASSAKQTASNKVRLDGERRALREAVETEAREGRERAAERQRAEALAAAEQQEAKARLQERMAAGEATGAEARAEGVGGAPFDQQAAREVDRQDERRCERRRRSTKDEVVDDEISRHGVQHE